MKAFARIIGCPVVASSLVAAVLTGLLYGDAVGLPLFSDDLVQIPWLESVSWAELWSSPSPYGYFRPLWYSIWRVWGWVSGGLAPEGLHLLNLSAHWLASLLTGLLAAAWMRRDAPPRVQSFVACLSSGLFAVFPFSRQAVAWPGAIYSPLVSAMAAATLLAYDRGRYAGRRAVQVRWMALALTLAALAPLMYEVGLMLAPLVALAEMLGWLHRRWPRRFSWWPGAFLLASILMLSVWRTARGASVTGYGLNAEDVRLNISFLLQGLVFPTAPLPQVASAGLGLDGELGLWIVALPTLGLLGWRGLRQSRATFLLGLGWYALFSIPPLVAMQADWFALAPRYLYMTATGVSLVWTAAILDWFVRRPAARSRCLAIVVLLPLLVVPAIAFVRAGLRLYAMVGQPIHEAATAAARERPILLVNLPLRISPHKRTYPLGFEGVTPLPSRVTAEGLVYVHTGLRGAAEAVAFGIVAQDEPTAYTYQLTARQVGWEELMKAVQRARTVYVTRYESERIYLVEAGGPLNVASLLAEPLAHYDDLVTLMAATAVCEEDRNVRLTLEWRTDARVATDATIFVHLLDDEGTLVTQADGHPLQGMLPLWLWQPGHAFRDVRYLDTGKEAVCADGCQIRLGLWDPATGHRWLAEGWPDGSVLLAVECR